MNTTQLFLILILFVTNYCITEEDQTKMITIRETYKKYITYLIPHHEKERPQYRLMAEILKEIPNITAVASIIKDNPIDKIDDGKLISPLMAAIIFGHNSIVELLIKAKVDIKQVNKREQNAVMMAAFANNQDALKKLIEAGAVLDAVDNLGCDAFDYAKCKEHSQITQILLEAKVKEKESIS